MLVSEHFLDLFHIILALNNLWNYQFWYYWRSLDAVIFHDCQEEFIFANSPIVIFRLIWEFLRVFSNQWFHHPFINFIHKLSGVFRVWNINNFKKVFILLFDCLSLLALYDMIRQSIDFLCIEVVHNSYIWSNYKQQENNWD